MMPRNAIAEILRTLSLPVPQAKVEAAPVPVGTFLCHKTGRPGTKMDRAPFKGPIGAWIAAHISKETFDDWIKQGTKVINELRLDLSRDQDAETYDRYMHEYLGLTEEDLERLRADDSR
jgi:Fe-S cluster biosynthesis and repair protein YggX